MHCLKAYRNGASKPRPYALFARPKARCLRYITATLLLISEKLANLPRNVGSEVYCQSYGDIFARNVQQFPGGIRSFLSWAERWDICIREVFMAHNFRKNLFKAAAAAGVLAVFLVWGRLSEN